MATVIFENVSLQKGERTILERISFEILHQQHWAIIGENGSGKSSLIDALAGKLFPRNGKITKPHFSEIELVHRDYSFHRLVGPAYHYYQQRFNAFDAEIAPTVWEVLQNQAKPVGTKAANSFDLPPLLYSETHLAAIAELLKIDQLLHRPIVTLSNGETRRTLIAFSLLKSPKLLLLDTPFSGLDVASRSLLHGVLNQIASDGKTQIVLAGAGNELPDCITHILELANSTIKQKHHRPFSNAILKETTTTNLPLKNIEEWFETSENSEFESVIHFRNTVVNYGNLNVVDHVNWEVKRGEKWALMGANGSGKSTLLSLVVGDNPQAYQNDFDLFGRKRGSGESIWEIKKKIGYVSPELHLYFPRNTVVWKAVASGLFDAAGLFKKLTEEQAKRVEKYMQLIDIQHLSERKLSEISSGEQRLVFLARALVKNPPLLILDEPCQGLDTNHMVLFRTLVNALVLKLNKTLIYVTHYEEEIPECVNKRLVLAQGKVVE